MNPAQYGRNGDSQLVHMRPDELQALGLLAQATGNNLTINPQTGYPEAWALPKWVLPVAAIAATALTAGAAAPAAAGALGAASAGTAAAGAGAAGAAGAGLGTAAGGTALGTSGMIGSGLGTSGLLAAGEGASMAGGSAFGTALGNTTAGTSAGLLGGASATQAAAPILNQNTAAGMFDKANYASDGLLGNAVDAYDKYGSTAGKVANAAQSAIPEPQQPIQAQPLQNAPLNLSGVLSQANEQKLYDEQENMRRRQLMQQYVSGIRGY